MCLCSCSVHVSRQSYTNTAALSGETGARLFKEADSYFTGNNGVAADKVKALELYKKSAEKSYIPAMLKVAGLYHSGEIVEQDQKVYFLWLSKAAEFGSAEAQNKLGVCYSDGIGTEKNPIEAKKWYEYAVMLGNVYAMDNLALTSWEENDTATAVKWTRMAAENGMAAAQCRLGEYYHNAIGVDKDMEQAEYWYKQSANQGNPNACDYLGVICFNRKDYSGSLHYAQEALKNGSVNVYNNLGFLYEFGYGVDQDLAMAVQYYQKAIEVKNANRNSALFRLGLMYYNGNDAVQKDEQKGLSLIKEAAGNGYKEATQFLEDKGL